jgi:hypothetical protein
MAPRLLHWWSAISTITVYTCVGQMQMEMYAMLVTIR